MTLPAPRVAIVDDNPEHVRVLAASLHAQGIACLPIHFTGEVDWIPRCPHLRVLFADLNLVNAGAGTTNAQHFTTIVSLLEETFVPTGPYAVVLWTRFSDQAADLRLFLEERLMGVPKPFAVIALDKMQHLNQDNTVRDAQALATAVSELLGGQPQFAALFNWEERILGASAATVSAVIELATRGTASGERGQAIGKLLYRLAYEAVGEKNVDSDRFRAVNEALLPILADRISALRSDNDAVIWESALAGQSDASGLTLEEAAQLNKLVNVEADAGSAADRGAVVALSADMLASFEDTFGVAPQVAGTKEFACRAFAVADARFRWMLVQLQAICDFAQQQPGPLPYVLGLEMPFGNIPDNAPGSVFQTPAFDVNGESRTLRINTRFLITKTRATTGAMTRAYRLREGQINEFGHQLHSQGSRPGMIAFRQRSAKTTVPTPAAQTPAPPGPPAAAPAPASPAPAADAEAKSPAPDPER
jgi:hypothetical protein